MGALVSSPSGISWASEWSREIDGLSGSRAALSRFSVSVWCILRGF